MTRALVLSLVVVFLALTGCQRGDPHAVPIEAASPAALGRWRIKFAERLSPEEWREFDAALQELRLRVTADAARARQQAGRPGNGDPAEPIDAAICRHVDGRSWREVVVLGGELKLQRLETVRAELKRAIDGNALLVTQPGDRSAAQELAGFRARQAARLTQTDAEIEATVQRLRDLGVDTAAAVPTGSVAPPPLPREVALAEINALIEGTRQAALAKYGEWPVTLDGTGERLPPDDRARFEERRAGAATNGNVVVAVRVKGRWWIYDAPVAGPQFSPAVTAHLTPADEREITARWIHLQAEIWARRAAHEQN